MATNSFFRCLRDRLRELRVANAANVTTTFALATVPMVGFVGAAVDYSHANQVKAAMQAAADSTALMLAKSASAYTDSELQTKANDYFKALFTRNDATSLLVGATYTSATGSKVVVNASSQVKTNFMGLMGFSSLKVAVDSQVKWGTTRMRVALALDNTGSMADDGKMDALKTATKNLLDQLKQAAAVDGDVLVSIVPFSKDVNIGKSKYNQSIVDFTEWDEENGNDVNTTKCYSSRGRVRRCTTSTNWVPDNHNTWNGCVTDRGWELLPSLLNTDTNLYGLVGALLGTLGLDSKFVAEQYDDCPREVMELGSNFGQMKGHVETMRPAGNTNQNIGLAHAWLTLTGGGPYATPPAEDPNYKYQKIIILLTDGLNTENRWYNNQAQIDARQKMTCDNINAAGITLYTIQVSTNGDPLQNVLKNCAGAPGTYPDNSKFFMITSANQMVSVFSQIGTQMSKLRIAE